jgi:hypothetical protein
VTALGRSRAVTVWVLGPTNRIVVSPFRDEIEATSHRRGGVLDVVDTD